MFLIAYLFFLVSKDQVYQQLLKNRFKQLAQPMTEEERRFIFQANARSKDYIKKRGGILDRFLTCVREYDSDTKWGTFIDTPGLFKDLFKSPPIQSQKMVFNDMMRRFVYSLKTKCKAADRQYYQPSTTNKMMRMLFAEIKEKYGNLPWTLSDFNFEGGFGSTLKELYADRQVKMSVSFFKKLYLL